MEPTCPLGSPLRCVLLYSLPLLCANLTWFSTQLHAAWSPLISLNKGSESQHSPRRLVAWSVIYLRSKVCGSPWRFTTSLLFLFQDSTRLGVQLCVGFIAITAGTTVSGRLMILQGRECTWHNSEWKTEVPEASTGLYLYTLQEWRYNNSHD